MCIYIYIIYSIDMYITYIHCIIYYTYMRIYALYALVTARYGWYDHLHSPITSRTEHLDQRVLLIIQAFIWPVWHHEHLRCIVLQQRSQHVGHIEFLSIGEPSWLNHLERGQSHDSQIHKKVSRMSCFQPAFPSDHVMKCTENNTSNQKLCSHQCQMGAADLRNSTK